MSLNSAQTLSKSAGDLYLAPLGTGAPEDTDLVGGRTAVDATLIGAGWTHVGWLDEDGPQFEGFEGDNTKLYGWNATAPVRSITRVTEPMISVGLLQWNASNLTEFFPGATYDAGTRTLTVPESGSPTERELLAVVYDGDDKSIGVWVGKVSNRGGESFEFPGDGLSVIPVVYDILSTGDPEEFIAFVNVDEDAESGS
jgi:hypothetical protein